MWLHLTVWRIDWIDPFGGRACLDACAACARLGDAEALKSWAKRAERHYADALGSCSHAAMPHKLSQAVIRILILHPYFQSLFPDALLLVWFICISQESSNHKDNSMVTFKDVRYTYTYQGPGSEDR